MRKFHKKQTPTPKIAKSTNFALIGIVALLVARPLVPEDPGGQAGYGVAFVLLWLLLAMGWIAQQWRSVQAIAALDLADFLLLGLVGWHTLAAVIGTAYGSPRPAVNMLWEWVSMGLVFLLARRIIPCGIATRSVIVVIIGLSVGLSLVAIEQRFISMPQDYQAFEQVRDDPAKLYELTGQWMARDSPELSRFESRLRSQQPSATFALTNSLAGFLLPWSLLLTAILLDGEFRTSINSSRFAAGGLALMVVLLALVLTGSRTAILASAVGMAAIGAISAGKSPRLRVHRRIVGVVFTLASCGAILALASGLGREVFRGATRSLAFRGEYWQATLRMIADRPLFGWGPGQFQDSYTGFKLPTASEEIQDPHNWLLEVSATAGVPAGILLVLLLFVIAWRIVRSLQLDDTASEVENDDRREPLSGAACGLVLGQILAFTNGFTPSLRQLVLIAAGIVSIWWVFRPWIRAGKLDPIVMLIAVAALLLNLTAAGGIGYPSIAESLWLLAAIGLSLNSGPRGDGVTTAGGQQAVRFGSIATCVALFVVAYVTSYRPVTSARAWLARADAAFLSGNVKQQAAVVEAATAADRWSVNAARRMVALRLAEYQRDPRADRLATVTDSVDRMLDLAPRKSGAWQYASEVAETVYRQSNDRQQLETAIGRQRQAIEHYPASSQLHSRLANLLKEAGHSSEAINAAREALRLDDLMRLAGHADRRLSPEEQKKLREIAGEGATFDAEKP